MRLGRILLSVLIAWLSTSFSLAQNEVYKFDKDLKVKNEYIFYRVYFASNNQIVTKCTFPIDWGQNISS